jgi:hypothetical protein
VHAPAGAEAGQVQGEADQAQDNQARGSEYGVGRRGGDTDYERDSENDNRDYGKHLEFLLLMINAQFLDVARGHLLGCGNLQDIFGFTPK